MSTKRIPIHRPIRAQIPPDALDLFREMKNVKCTFPPIDWKGRYWERHECPGCEHVVEPALAISSVDRKHSPRTADSVKHNS